MLRFILWLLFYIVLLGAPSIDAKYHDGLHIKFYGWADAIARKKAERKESINKKKNEETSK